MLPNGTKIGGITGDEHGTDSSRRQRDKNIEVNLSGFVDVVPVSSRELADNPAGFSPVPLTWCNHKKASLQLADKSFHFSGSRTPRQFGHNHGTASDDVFEFQKLLLEASGPQVVDVDRCVKNGKVSCGQSRLALPFHCSGGSACDAFLFQRLLPETSQLSAFGS